MNFTFSPRSAESSGIVIILEELQNLNIFREFKVDKNRVSKALEMADQK